MLKNQSNQVMVHDINASISALRGAVDIITDEWRSNPDLVDKIIPLTSEKILELQSQLSNYYASQQNLPPSQK
jgi:hypothetical protein